MKLSEQLKRQRVKYIISSYQLAGQDTDAFHCYLDDLLLAYPSPLIELALVEVLLDMWVRVPMQRGCDFLVRAHHLLMAWEGSTIASTIAPEQFQQITGLDPSPIFGSSENEIVPPQLRSSC